MFRLLSIALLSASLLLIPPAEARTSGQKDTPTLVIAGPGINSDGGVLFYHVQQMFSMGAKGFKPTTVQFHGNAAHVKGRAPIPAKRGDKRAIKGAAIRAGKMASENPHAMLRLDMDLMGVGIALGKGVAGAPFRLVGKTRLAREAGATIDAIRTRWDLETERASAFIEEAAREFKKKHGDKAKVIVVGHSAFTNAINLTPLDDPRTGKPLIDFRVMSSPMIRKVKYQDPDRTMFVTHENDLPPANMGSFISPLSMTEQDLTWAGTVLHLKGKTLNPFSAHSETQYYNTVYDMEIRTPGAKQTFRGRTPAEVIMRYKDAVFRGERRPQKTLLNSLKKQTPKESRVGGITLTKPADLPLNPSGIVNIDIGRLSDWPLFNFGAQGIIRLPDNLDKDAAAAAMKCVYLDRPPELSLMPGRSRKGEPLTMVQYLSKHLGLTKLGDLMLEADRILAAVAWGGSASYRPPEGIPGYHPFSEIALDHETFWNGSLGARVWVVPASIRFSAKHGRFSVEDATMAVRFEFYPMDKERVYYEKNADVGFSDPAGDFLAAQLTGHFDALAAQYPALEKLKRAAEFVGILIWAKENKIPLSSDARQWIKSNYRTDRDTNLYTGKPRRLEQIGNYLFEVLPFVDVRKADPAAVARPAIIFNQFGISRILWPQGKESVIEYDGNGRIEGVQSRDGARIRFHYDEENRPVAVAEESGQGIAILWDEGLASAVYWAKIDNQRLECTVDDEARLIPLYDPRVFIQEWIRSWITAEREGRNGFSYRQRLKDLGTTISWVRWSQDWRHLIYALVAAIVFVLVLQFSTRNPAQVFYRLRRPATLTVYVLSALSVFFLVISLNVFSPPRSSAGTVQPEQYWFVWLSLFFLALWAFKPRKTWFWSVVPCVVVGGAFFWAAMTLSPDHALSDLFLGDVFSVGTVVMGCAFTYHFFRDSLPVQQSGSVLVMAAYFLFYSLPLARDMVAGWSVAAAQLPAAATVDVATQAAAISLIQLVDVTAPSLPLAYPQAGLLLPALAFAMAAFFLNWRAGDVGPGGMGWPGKTTSLEKAKAIMGRWMAAPSDVERHFGIAYSPRELKKLSRIPWAEDVLKDAAKTHVLFPGYPLTVVDLCEKAHSSFLGSDSLDWYRSKRFTSRKTVDLRWHLIRKETRQFGAGTYGDHVAGLNRAEELPRAVEVAYLIALFDHVARVDLFTETVVHCADQTKAGYHAGVGWGGVGSWADWATYPATHFRLQLAPSRKPYR